MNALCDVPRQAVFPGVVGSDGECAAVSVRDDQRLVVEGGQEPEGEKVEEAGEEHALDVRYQLGLTNQPVQSGRLLKALQAEGEEFILLS